MATFEELAVTQSRARIQTASAELAHCHIPNVTAQALLVEVGQYLRRNRIRVSVIRIHQRSYLDAAMSFSLLCASA
jgi:hypothetical protein